MECGIIYDGRSEMGKEICKALKEIRRKIAEENDINLVIEECTYQGECKGTCPRCEEELRYLENELEKRKKLGKTIAIVGITAATVGGAYVVSKPVIDAVIDCYLDPICTEGAIDAIKP